MEKLPNQKNSKQALNELTGVTIAPKLLQHIYFFFVCALRGGGGGVGI